MKSPITGREMKLIFENRELIYRRKKFSYIAQLWLCEDSGEMFTTSDMDDINIGQVYNQYLLYEKGEMQSESIDKTI